jgi:hypothetical protein
MGKEMRSQNNQIKTQNKLLFCKLCSFMTEDLKELDFHIKFTHEDVDDEISEFEFEQMRKEKSINLYLRVCKSEVCIIRKQIDLEDDKLHIKS